MNRTTRTWRGTTEGIDRLTESERHGLLSSERRRTAIDVLGGLSGPVELEELAAAVAAREDGGTADEVAVERVAVQLHHVHLPKMADMGVLDYEADTNLIR